MILEVLTYCIVCTSIAGYDLYQNQIHSWEAERTAHPELLVFLALGTFVV